MTMKIVRRRGGFWITKVPDSITELGPYTKHGEADSDRLGLVRFFKKFDKEQSRRSKRRSVLSDA